MFGLFESTPTLESVAPGMMLVHGERGIKVIEYGSDTDEYYHEEAAADYLCQPRYHKVEIKDINGLVYRYDRAALVFLIVEMLQLVLKMVVEKSCQVRVLAACSLPCCSFVSRPLSLSLDTASQAGSADRRPVFGQKNSPVFLAAHGWFCESQMLPFLVAVAGFWTNR